MYREKIRDNYERLSRSYRRVADFVLSNYYEVSFMTAAQLAVAVGVDTTTVVRFSQRLGYDGYPNLLSDIRDQVKSEIYATYEPSELEPHDEAATFKTRIEQECQNLTQILIHCPPAHLRDVARLLFDAHEVFLVAEGYAEVVAAMAAEQLRHRGIRAVSVPQDVVKRAAAMTALTPQTLVIGVSATAYGDDVARTLTYARRQGCKTLGLVGSLASPVNRVADRVLYAPTDVPGPLPSIVALTAAMSALVQVMTRDSNTSSVAYLEQFGSAYQYLLEREDADTVPP